MESRKRAPDAQEFLLVISPSRDAGFRAAEAVRQRFRALAEQTSRDLAAVVTELVNNAVEHGPGRPITVRVVHGGDSMRGEVVDQGNPAASSPRTGARGVVDREGLALVDRLTSRWAVREGSTDVWFEIPLAR